MNSGVVFSCDYNGLVLNVYRDDFDIFSNPVVPGNHLSRYISSSSKETVTRFFFKLSSDGLSSSKRIEFLTTNTPKILYCTGIRAMNVFLVFGASSPSYLGLLISGILYSDDEPVDLAQICGTGLYQDNKRLTDYQIYEDLTRLNNELVDMSRELTDTQVEMEMKAEELNKEIKVRWQTEEALLVANKKLNLLSSITRHDIKNKVLIIQGFLHFGRKIKVIEEIDPFFDKIHDATKAIESQIDFTKDYQDLGVNSPVWLNLSDLIKSVGNSAIDMFDESGNLEIFADPLFEKVLYNLVDNSMRHGETVNRIDVSVITENEGIRIIWKDNGVGVPQDQKEKIFERGFGKNTGLGLFLIREILAITGMTIEETGEPGKGARFEIMVQNGKWRPGGNNP